MAIQLETLPLSAQEFQLYGDVIDTGQADPRSINLGNCLRYDGLAYPNAVDGEIGINVFQSRVFSLPFEIKMLERHPLGSQAFLPLSEGRMVIVVAEDNSGPVNLRAFVSENGQGVNYKRNVWHSPLTPIAGSGRYAVIDYAGTQANLEEHQFATPLTITSN